MGERIYFEKENTAIMIRSSERIKWEECCMSINAIYKAYYYGNFTGYDIYFKERVSKYFYKAENVRFLIKLKVCNIEKHDIYVNGEIVNADKVDSFEDGYYRLYVGNQIIFSKKVEFRSNKYRDILKYFTGLAGYAGEISNQQEPIYFLSQNYKRLYLSKQSVLLDYLQGEFSQYENNETIIVPFNFNQSQYKAIETAFKTNISIIEGPPGTGKTQTILNLIGNIIFRGKNCAVVSNNNTAVENVYEKLNEEGLSHIAAKLGSHSNVISFFESDQNESLENFKSAKKENITSDFRKIIEELSKKMKLIQEIEVKYALLNTQLNEIEIEKKKHDETFQEESIINQNLKSMDYLTLIRRLERPKKLGLIRKWILENKFKVKVSLSSINNILSNAEKLIYGKKILEISGELKLYEQTLNNYDKDRIRLALKNLSRKVIDNKIMLHYQRKEFMNFNARSYKNDYNNFVSRYPVILSTSQSLLNNAPKGFLFDYLIIDEASQGDLLSSVLAISCAKNLIVVGDSRQLQQIEEERLFIHSEKLAMEFDIPKEYSYVASSILKSVKDAIPTVPTTLLKEHYRCAPDIINFCNKMFYNNELIVLTKNRDQHIEVIKTVPGNHARKNPYGSGMYNQREIDEINLIVEQSDSKSIGIISPFRYQANLIQSMFKDKNVEADTIHKFQGREKDEIILSFVVNSLDRDFNEIENKLYDFVTDEKLLNVAISRGKNKITLIVSDKIYYSKNNIINDLIKYVEYLYGSAVIKESTVSSVFDYLYTEYKNDLIAKFKEKPNSHKSELLMCEVIDEAIKNHRYIGYSMHVRLGKIVNVSNNFSEEEKRYILHPWTHVDFLFYNRVSKEKLFTLEVDGIKYHEQNEKQIINDEIKNKVLKENDLPIYRFKTNESNELDRLRKVIENYVH